MTNRDSMIIEEYLEGRDILAIQREHGIQQRRIYQILRDNGVSNKRKRSIDPEKPAISGVHYSIGRRVYEFYFEKGLDRRQAANELGVSLPTMRNIENGWHRLDLFDLQDIAAYLKTTVGELLNES